MYNIFKRPMFKLGGQADQGTGIMSTVEPRPTYMFGNIVQPLTPFQNTYTELPAYAYGGRIGYQTAGPVLPGTLPDNEITRSRILFDEQQKDIQEENRKKLGITSVPVKKEEEGFLSSIFGKSDDEKLLIKKGVLSPNAPAAERIKALNALKLSRQAGRTEDVAPVRENTIRTKTPTTTEATTTDPRGEIKREAGMLKELLRDEGLSTAENALIVAKALATPGGFNAKIQAAADLALPIIRQRSKLDRELVLEAYKTSKEIEKAKIAAGKKSPTQEILEESVQAQLKVATQTIDPITGKTLYNGKTEDQIRNQVYSAYTQKIPYTRQETAIVAIEKAKDTIAKITEEARQKGKQPDEAIIKRNQEIIKINEKLLSGQLYAKGGRVKKQLGGVSNETDTQTSETLIDTNVEGVPEKPVQKLSFEEIRTRLPKEITDDIVRLISNSAEALQDFSYIRTQQDVNEFNIKYGVNLILPQGA